MAKSSKRQHRLPDAVAQRLHETFVRLVTRQDDGLLPAQPRLGQDDAETLLRTHSCPAVSRIIEKATIVG
jgi:hypothetical protein